VVVPPRFERGAFRLGGGRSIQLSYGTVRAQFWILNCGFWIVKVLDLIGVDLKTCWSRIVTDQRLDPMSVELASAVQKIQFYNEKQPGNFPAKAFDEIDDSFGGAAGG
jgi:hypothetical protein